MEIDTFCHCESPIQSGLRVTNECMSFWAYMPFVLFFNLGMSVNIYYEQKNSALSVQAFSGETVMMLKGNNVGFVALVGILIAGAIKVSGTPKSRIGLGSGLLKVIRSDNWRTKATIARGSFIV